MKTGKRSAKSSAKKSVTPKKASSVCLATVLLSKHSKARPQQAQDANQIALLLQTVLSGNDQQLHQVLTSWSNAESVEAVVNSWGPSNTKLFFHRICSLLHEQPCPWAYPWVQQILKSNTPLNEKDMRMLRDHISNERRLNLDEVLKCQGKLTLFDI